MQDLGSEMALDAGRDQKTRETLDQAPKLAGSTKLEMLTAAMRNRREGGAPLRLLFKAMRGPGRLKSDEVFYYRLLDGDISEEEAQRFVGKLRQAFFHKKCNNPEWFAAAHDKLLFYSVMAGAGFITPETIAFVGSNSRAGFNYLKPADFNYFLSQNQHWPLFAKPVDGIFSIGAIKIEAAYETDVQITGFGCVPIGHLLEYIQKISENGYLIQKCLAPSSFSKNLFSDSVASVRMLVLLSKDGPTIESAIIKIPALGAMADNYWRSGNMIGALNRDTGEITRVVSGVGQSMAIHTHHPNTGAELLGRRLPDWIAICDCATSAASCFPGVRTQSWDIALTDKGPLPLEFNYGGDLNLHQIAHRRGALTDSFVAHLNTCGISINFR